jgi:hypothetical protein
MTLLFYRDVLFTRGEIEGIYSLILCVEDWQLRSHPMDKSFLFGCGGQVSLFVSIYLSNHRGGI